MAEAKLVAFDFTHVRYTEGDHVGHLLAFVTLAPIFIHVGLFSALLSRRELRVAALLVGLTLNEVFSVLLKKQIKEPRPPTCAALEMCDSYGMSNSPTCHLPAIGRSEIKEANYMVFASAHAVLDLTGRLKRNAVEPLHAAVCAATPPFALLVMYARVYLGYHSTHQVLAGASVGLITGTAWYTATSWLGERLYPGCHTCGGSTPSHAANAEDKAMEVPACVPMHREGSFLADNKALERSALCRLLSAKDSSHLGNAHRIEYTYATRARLEKLK